MSQNLLYYEVLIDGKTIFNSEQHSMPMSYEFLTNNEQIQEHVFQIKVNGKRKLIESKSDTEAALNLEKLEMDNINILPMVQGKYLHNFNGFGEDTVEEFSTVLGCDGILEFTFLTPLSHWVALDYPY